MLKNPIWLTAIALGCGTLVIIHAVNNDYNIKGGGPDWEVIIEDSKRP
jgi:hypothetical protein